MLGGGNACDLFAKYSLFRRGNHISYECAMGDGKYLFYFVPHLAWFLEFIFCYFVVGKKLALNSQKIDMCVANINIQNLCHPLNFANLFRLVICIGWGHSTGLCVAFLRLCFN